MDGLPRDSKAVKPTVQRGNEINRQIKVYALISSKSTHPCCDCPGPTARLSRVAGLWQYNNTIKALQCLETVSAERHHNLVGASPCSSTPQARHHKDRITDQPFCQQHNQHNDIDESSQQSSLHANRGHMGVVACTWLAALLASTGCGPHTVRGVASCSRASIVVPMVRDVTLQQSRGCPTRHTSSTESR